MLAADERTVFLGQGVAFPGTFMSRTLEGVPATRKIEMPVAEEMQMGASIGLALAGHVPVTIYPRWNFLILAVNQLINHLDKMDAKAIVRVGVGSDRPMYPGAQHLGDFTEAFMSMTQSVQFVRLRVSDDVLPEYEAALRRDQSTVLVEYADRY